MELPALKTRLILSGQQNGKIPPQALEMERAVLGACMISPVFPDVSELLDEKCFYNSTHALVYASMSALQARSCPIDILTVVDQLQKIGQLEACGGAYNVTTLTNDVVSGANVISHCRVILQAYMKRELIRISGELNRQAFEEMGDAFELLDTAEEAILKIRQRTEFSTYKQLDSVLVETFKHLESIRHREDHLTGVTSGYKELDKVTCGWQNTDLIILAARPSVGKTAFALNLAINAAKDNSVGFFSLEMSERQLAHRALSSESGIFLWSLRNGKMGDPDMKILYEKGIQPLANHKVFIDDTANIKLSDLKAKARRMVLKDGCKIIFIDYLQLITTTQQFNRKDLEVGHISSQLKGLAKDLNVPIICLSQLSRDVEKRGPVGEPKLSDLRESGAIEQDADMVIFLWRPTEADIQTDAELMQFCNVKIEKHRNGTLEKFLGKFTKEIQRWEYLKVLDTAGVPIGGAWKPVSNWNNK